MKTFKLLLSFYSIFFLISFSATKCFSQSQESQDLYNNVHPYIDIKDVPGSKVECEKLIENVPGGNFIRNNGFKTDAINHVTNPFASGEVPLWVETHGTPALDNFVSPATTPPPGLENYASMYSWGDGDKLFGEGIAQVIPTIKKGVFYDMSFFKKLADESHTYETGMDKFFIVLMHCKDYEKIHTYPGYTIPDIPAGSQIIYVEGDLKNADWEQISTQFTSEDDYDMVWIFPKQDPKVTILLGVDFTGLVITESAVAETNFSCSTAVVLTGCNYITNPGFLFTTVPAPNPSGAFNQGDVVPWQDTHGTCDVGLAGAPVAGTNFAKLGLGRVAANNHTEGLAQKLPSLTQGNSYQLSFYISTSSYFPIPAQPPAPNATNVRFQITLINCQEFPGATSNTTPAYALPNQVIYCENLGTIGGPEVPNNWRHIVVSFTANRNYDMVRFDPSFNINPTSACWSFVNIALPELMNATLNAGAVSGPAPGTCNVTIGPTTPNTCAVNGGVFTWIGPAQQQIPAPANQQITFSANDPNNVGMWTLQLAVPDAVLPAVNDACTQMTYTPITATVNVPLCTCPTPAQIISSSYFESGCGDGQTWPNQEPIIPNIQNHYCYAFECGDRAHLKTNFATGNEWYVNDVLINGVSGNELSYFCHSGAGAPFQFKFQVKNNSFGCGLLSPPTYIYVVPSYIEDPTGHNVGGYAYDGPGDVITVSTPFDVSHGPGSIYSWYIPYTSSITSNNDNTPQSVVTFASNVLVPPAGPQPFPWFMGTLTVSNSIYCNGVYNILFSWHGLVQNNQRSILLKTNQENHESKFEIFPNPATDQLSIFSKIKFSYIEVSNFNGAVIKKIHIIATNHYSINIQELRAGIYNCRIVGANETENKKLIIVR